MSKRATFSDIRGAAKDQLLKGVLFIRSPFARGVQKSERATKKKAGDIKRPLFVRFSTQDQIFFAKRLGMILRAGMPIMEGLHMLSGENRTSSGTHIYQSLIVD